jgi:glycosyltransferase involved in cell wall biosynthesis
MRLALVCDWYPPRVGGIEIHVRALAGQLAAAGHAVDVITTAAGSPDAAPPASPGGAPTPFGAVRVRRLALACLPRVAVSVAPGTTAAVAGALAGGGYDLVHAHASVLSPLAFAAAAAGSRLGIPTVVTHHSVLGRTVGLFAAADRVLGWTGWPVLHTAVSPLVAGELGAAAARRGVRLAVRVLPNGIHPEAWAPAPGARRGRGAADGGEFRVASVMRLAGRKRPHALVAVASRVRAALPPGVRLRLRVAGDGPERRALERSVERHGLGDAVELLGWRPPAEVRELFAASDAFVLPSILESFGLAALEARCAGLPVVAMRRAGPAGFVRDGVEGLLADDDAGLAAALVRLALDDRLRAGIARHNRTTRPAETWDAVLERHAAVYAEARHVAVGSRVRSSARPAPAVFAGPAA